MIEEDSEKRETRTTISNIVEAILKKQKSITVYNVHAVLENNPTDPLENDSIMRRENAVKNDEKELREG